MEGCEDKIKKKIWQALLEKMKKKNKQQRRNS